MAMDQFFYDQEERADLLERWEAALVEIERRHDAGEIVFWDRSLQGGPLVPEDMGLLELRDLVAEVEMVVTPPKGETDG